MPRINQPIRDLASILTDVRKRLKKLETARPLESATISKGGLQVLDGGSLKVVDPVTGNVVFYLGSSTVPDGSGRPQMVMQLFRDDGTLAFALGDFGTTPGHAHQQAWTWRDRSGAVVVADDTISGLGLAAPLLETGGLHDTNTSKWPATTATVFTAIADGYMQVQNPRLTWQINLFSDAGVTSQFQLLVNGTQVGTTQTVAANSFSLWSANGTMPAGAGVGSTPYVQLMAKSSAATGSARAQCLRLCGQSS